jgi:hypothetical protein
MDHKPALYALLRLHAEIGGKIKYNERKAKRLIANMKHVEAVLHLLEPGFYARSISARRRYNPNPLFKRGHVFGAALEVLRAAPEPMTADEISLALLRSKGVESPSLDELRHIWGAVSASLRNGIGKTVTADDGRPRRWRLVCGSPSSG